MSTNFPFPDSLMRLGTPEVTGTPGPAGEDGLSAYELAVEAGFVGTLEEWLTSLKGDPGPQGEPGIVDGYNVDLTGMTDGQTIVLDADTSTLVPGTAAGGVEPGGTDGQFYVKQSSADGDVGWETHYTVPAGGADEALLAKSAATDGATEWIAGNTYLRFESGTQAEIDAMTKNANTIYLVISA